MYIYTNTWFQTYTTAYENISKVVYKMFQHEVFFNNDLNGIVIKKNKMTFVVVTF